MQVYIYTRSPKIGALSCRNKEQSPDSKHSESTQSKPALASADTSAPWEKKLSFLPGTWQGHYKNFKHTDCEVRVNCSCHVTYLGSPILPGVVCVFCCGNGVERARSLSPQMGSAFQSTEKAHGISPDHWTGQGFMGVRLHWERPTCLSDAAPQSDARIRTLSTNLELVCSRDGPTAEEPLKDMHIRSFQIHCDYSVCPWQWEDGLGLCMQVFPVRTADDLHLQSDQDYALWGAVLFLKLHALVALVRRIQVIKMEYFHMSHLTASHIFSILWSHFDRKPWSVLQLLICSLRTVSSQKHKYCVFRTIQHVLHWKLRITARIIHSQHCFQHSTALAYTVAVWK